MENKQKELESMWYVLDNTIYPNNLLIPENNSYGGPITDVKETERNKTRNKTQDKDKTRNKTRVNNVYITLDNLPKELVCPKCIKADDNDFIEKDGFVICTLCGLILKNRISEQAEWNNYPKEGGATSSARCGSSTRTTDINPFRGPGSSFMPKGVKNVCIKDGKIVRYDITKLHVQHTFNHRQKSFVTVEDVLDKSAVDKYSSRVVRTAKILWGEVMKTKKVTRSGVRKGMIACCLYYACVHHNCTRSPLEISKDFGMNDTKKFNKGDREFKDTFETIPKWSHLLIKTSNSDDYFSRFCSNLELAHIIKEGEAFPLAKECSKIYDDIKEEMEGIFPKSAASGILFWSLKKKGNPVTKTKVAKTLGICSPTLTKIYDIVVKKIESKYGLLSAVS
jgi:transcription initiation factor TFIIIB Brf1 subunit/transcription initiation factor TFIIB